MKFQGVKIDFEFVNIFYKRSIGCIWKIENKSSYDANQTSIGENETSVDEYRNSKVANEISYNETEILISEIQFYSNKNT